jgi:hypothetical protein
MYENITMKYFCTIKNVQLKCIVKNVQCFKKNRHEQKKPAPPVIDIISSESLVQSITFTKKKLEAYEETLCPISKQLLS